MAYGRYNTMEARIMRVFLMLAAVDGLALGQEPALNPDRIKIVQEREAHERAVAGRIAYQLAQQPEPAAEPTLPVRHLSPQEMQDLTEALDRYFREHRGRVPILWAPSAR